MTLDEFQARLERLSELKASQITIGTTDSEAGKIIRALEFGSVAGQKPWPHPGPRTSLAVNPETGAQIVVSQQMPRGLIRVRKDNFLAQLMKFLTAGDSWLDGAETQTLLEQSVRDTGGIALAEVRNALSRTSPKVRDALALSNGSS